jgi:hypothetical protein
MDDDKKHEDETALSPPDLSVGSVTVDAGSEDEVFATGANGVNFRTVGWLKAAIFLLKMTFAAGVLSIPASLYTLGAVAGAIFILFWGVLNTYMAYIQGHFKMTHPSVHTVADAAYIAALDLGKCSKGTAFVIREMTDALYMYAACTVLPAPVTWADSIVASRGSFAPAYLPLACRLR